jgi:hypothetical protein
MVSEAYLETSPKLFTGWDYLLCTIAFFLAGIAFVPEFLALIVRASS